MSVQLDMSRKKVSELQLRVDSFAHDRQSEERELTLLRDESGRYRLTIEKLTRELADSRRLSSVDVRPLFLQPHLHFLQHAIVRLALAAREGEGGAGHLPAAGAGARGGHAEERR